jgi:hypothetical protein
VLVANKFDNSKHFYEFIEAEKNVRHFSKDMKQVYFIVLFACCRENYFRDKKKGVCAGKQLQNKPKCFKLCALNNK